jgi:hypothetical protein
MSNFAPEVVQPSSDPANAPEVAHPERNRSRRAMPRYSYAASSMGGLEVHTVQHNALHGQPASAIELMDTSYADASVPADSASPLPGPRIIHGEVSPLDGSFNHANGAHSMGRPPVDPPAYDTLSVHYAVAPAPSFTKRHKKAFRIAAIATAATVVTAAIATGLGLHFGASHGSSSPKDAPQSSSTGSAGGSQTSSSFGFTPRTTSTGVVTQSSSVFAVPSITSMPVGTSSVASLRPSSTTSAVAAHYTGDAQRVTDKCTGDGTKCQTNALFDYTRLGNDVGIAFGLTRFGGTADWTAYYNTTLSAKESASALQTIPLTGIDQELGPDCNRVANSSINLQFNSDKAIGTIYLNYTLVGACLNERPADCDCTYGITLSLDTSFKA